MVSHGPWFVVSMLAMLSGCIAVYGYDEFDGKGAGGASTLTGGSSASTANSSSGSIGTGGQGTGGQGTGGICAGAIYVCGESSLNCNSKLCFENVWAHRYGTAQNVQRANSVALDSNGNVIIGGMYVTDGMDPWAFDGKSVGVSVGTNGFVTRLDSGNPGNANKAVSYTGIEVQAVVAVPATDDVIVAGNKSDIDSVLVLEKINLVSDMTTPASTNLSGQLPGVDIHAVALALDAANNVYVLGTNLGKDSQVDCAPNTTVSLKLGMFLAKFDTNLKCQWIRSYAVGAMPEDKIQPTAIAVKNDNTIWITGTFLGNFNTGKDTFNTDTSEDMFLLGLNPKGNGATTFSAQYGNAMGSNGVLTPKAIDTDGNGKVYITGEVQGKTNFPGAELADNQQGAFVAMLDQIAGIATSVVWPGENAMASLGRGRGTGIALVENKLFVSGTFAGKMYLDSPNLLSVESSAGIPLTGSPFLAVLDAPKLQLLTFDAYGGDMKATETTSVYLAASTGSVALAGGWPGALDFSTSSGSGANGSLPELVGSTGKLDIFVAKFTAPP